MVFEYLSSSSASASRRMIPPDPAQKVAVTCAMRSCRAGATRRVGGNADEIVAVTSQQAPRA